MQGSHVDDAITNLSRLLADTAVSGAERLRELDRPARRPSLAAHAGPLLPSRQQQPVVRGAELTAPPVRRTEVALPATTPQGALPTGATQPPQGTSAGTIVRGQQPESGRESTPSVDYPRGPMPVSGVPRSNPSATSPARDANVVPAQFGTPYDSPYPGSPGYGPAAFDGNPAYDGAPPYGPPGTLPGTIGYANPALNPATPTAEFHPGPTDMPGPQPFTGRLADLIVNVREQQTGRFMFGVGVNSDAGLTAQIVVDEYNFDWKRFPRSVDDILNGTAWRGGGQRLRIEAIPGNRLQRYLVNFTEPYLFDTNISLNLSGYLYDRQYYDWNEQRLGGRIGLGYRLTPDLSLTGGMRFENVKVYDPRVLGVAELDDVLGNSALYSGRIGLTHDTRDSPFAATEGHFLELSFEQFFGTYEYPQGKIDYRKYFLLSERPDESGRHVLGTSLSVGLSGPDTPLYENFFAGGYSTLRGFRFRSASPQVQGVYVGGELSLLGSVEYMFPITADDMLKGVVFCDYGTIEEELKFNKDDFRVSFGAGLRIAIPAMGPAPIAVDFAVPVAKEETDRVQNFSFFVGFGR